MVLFIGSFIKTWQIQRRPLNALRKSFKLMSGNNFNLRLLLMYTLGNLVLSLKFCHFVMHQLEKF